MQVKLLQVLEEREFRRVGGTQMIPTNVRFMAATNRDLARAVKDGTFREDLYYRLNVVSVRIPPLRERREDIPALAQECVVQFAQELKRPARRIAPAALQMLARYHFPGNIRELQNMIERAVIFCDAPALDVEHFPPGVMFTTEAAPTVSTDQNAIHLTFQVGQDTLEKLDLSAIQKMLELTAGNKTEAARRLGLSRFSLERRLRKAQTQVRA
jgi:two-component system response regulator AtoC